MNALVEELKKNVSFKETTEAGDHVLIASENPRVIFYALVAAIERDASRKDEWYHVAMHVFSIPPQTVVWTLREPQYTGREIFTMQGVGHFMKAVQLDDLDSLLPGKKDLPTAPENIGSKKSPFHRVK